MFLHTVLDSQPIILISQQDIREDINKLARMDNRLQLLTKFDSISNYSLLLIKSRNASLMDDTNKGLLHREVGLKRPR